MILTLNRSGDNVFGSLKAPRIVEMPITNVTSNGSRRDETESDSPNETYMIKKEKLSTKRDRSHKSDDCLLTKRDECAEEPPKKKNKEMEAFTVKEEADGGYEELTGSVSGSLVEDCTDKDVLSGRGGGTNLHPGNRYYRDLILSHRAAYDEACKTMKPEISRQIVLAIKNRGGRFLRKDADGSFHEIGEAEAKAKTSQALRHRTFELRNTKDPDRVKMNGRWKQTGNERAKTTSPHTSSSGKACAAPSTSFNVSSFLDTPTASRNLLHDSSTASTIAADRTAFHESFRRQRLIEAAMSTSTSNVGLHSDAAYMTAITNLRHREAMFHLDQAIHEAEKRRYKALAYPSHLTSTFVDRLPVISVLPSSVSSLHRPPLIHDVGDLSRGISTGSSGVSLDSNAGTSLHDRALLHSRFGGTTNPLKKDFCDLAALHSGLLSMRDYPYSSASLNSRSRERLADMELLIRSRSLGGNSLDGSDRSNPQSPCR
ncbi:hypothetical protein IV203_017132 [Nitzschia inconspicua]|uniref:DUF6824 domain-containing protein n=1 Tax=Nitzschia inconspicua TaxID=303405 RepID=A0A9K3KRY8_9STRA|nr:hypothetical protein IV203_017132 [Nitzschia inconspicua]